MPSILCFEPGFPFWRFLGPNIPHTAGFQRRITAQDVADWENGTILDWANEGRQIAQAVAYGDLGNESPAPITAAYEKHPDSAIEVQLERAGVRLAWLLNSALK
jgi:hypothetical protein